MIAKHIPIRPWKKSGYPTLIAYLLAPKNTLERVGNVDVTRCSTDDPIAAANEVFYTQSMNERAESDKTYHLIVSFPSGEQPGTDVLREIEKAICAGLGFEEHQRISVVHHDTDNLHMHIAICKIHPVRHTIHSPFRDYATLARLCGELEERFGLKPDNHVPRRQGAQSHADSMEHHAGIESLLGWIRRECQDEMLAAGSWEALHATMARHGLVLRERGNGLIVCSDDGTAVKASSIDRAVSKAQLEKRFGPFKPRGPMPGEPPATKRYRKRPMAGRMDTGELYAAYLQARDRSEQLKAADRGMAREEKDRLIAAAKRRARLKRTALRLVKCDRAGKRLLHDAVSYTLLSEISHIQRTSRNDRKQADKQYPRQTWADWLCSEAQAGNAEALAALRSRPGRESWTGNALSGDRVEGSEAHDGHVTKHGTIIHRSGNTSIRDAGDRLVIAQRFTTADLEAALARANQCFGRQLHAAGSEAFRAAVARYAGVMGLDIIFDDPELERLRLSNLITSQRKEEGHEHRNGPGRGQVAGRSVRSGQQAAADGRAPGAAGTQRDAGAIGTRPPPASRNRLRELSALGMVRIDSGAEVLLPGDVPGHVEQPGTAADRAVRRPVHRDRQVADRAINAVQKYVLEREQKRLSLPDVPRHGAYDGFHGPAQFGGLRTVDGQALVLLRRDDEIQVMAVDAAMARRLARLRRGTTLSIGASGITTGGRHR